MKNINLLKQRKFAISIVFLLFSASIYAQADFSGTWGFNESKSNFGDSQFRFAATTMVVTRDGSTISVESTMPGRDGGETKTIAKYNLDGTMSENPMFNSTRKSTVAWSADKSSITITSIMTFERDGESREFKTSEIWKLSEAGKGLIIESSFLGADGDMKRTIAYDKK